MYHFRKSKETGQNFTLDPEKAKENLIAVINKSFYVRIYRYALGCT
jgi:hypothetical protein